MTSIPSPASLRRAFPLSSHQKSFIDASRKHATRILQRTEQQLICIVGPCSIHDPISALEYAKRLKRLSSEIEHSFFSVMRAFCEKPRSRCGWKGWIYDPNLDGSCDLAKGLRETRKLYLQLTDLQIPIATEFLDPILAPYFDDLISWGFIGARTSASQPHRQLASSLCFPIGFKNTIYGELSAALNGIYNAGKSHVYFGINETGSIATIHSKGNPLAHLVLRGSESGPNFDAPSIESAHADLAAQGLTSNLLIDCSHGNSKKDHRKQPDIFRNILQQIEEGTQGIAGMMLESHLFSGNQPHLEDPGSLSYGSSITDSCLGWEETEALLLEASRPISINSVQK